MNSSIIEFCFLIFAIVPIIHYGNTPAVGTFSLTFAAILLEALPFLLPTALRDAAAMN